jgi:hypothetical protein
MIGGEIIMDFTTNDLYALLLFNQIRTNPHIKQIKMRAWFMDFVRKNYSDVITQSVADATVSYAGIQLVVDDSIQSDYYQFIY